MQPMRRIPGCGMSNLRDLGGYPTAEGGATRYGVFYRADSARGMTQEKTEAFRALGISTVVDLRAPEEGRNQLAEIEGVEVLSIPLMQYQSFALIPACDSLAELYLQALDHARVEIATVLRALLEAKGGALFHCSAGKDRTGMIAALLLLLCGVAREDILADYQVSNTYIQPVIAQLTAMGHQVDPKLIISTPDMLEPFLEEIERRGGVREYLTTCGVADSAMDGLRDKLVNGSAL